MSGTAVSFTSTIHLASVFLPVSSDWPPTDAVTAALPFASPVTRPFSSTDTTDGASELHTNSACNSGMYGEKYAFNCFVSPASSIHVSILRLTDTSETLTLQLADFPLCAAAVIMASPYDRAVTVPFVSTEATSGWSLSQVTAGFVTSAGLTKAVKVRDSPGCIRMTARSSVTFEASTTLPDRANRSTVY